MLAPSEAADLLAHDLVVEEKVDGDNLGFSVTDQGLRAQHRGDYIRLDEGWRYPHLTSWLALHSATLGEALGPSLLLFGEWCAAQHTVRYDNLPDWFLVFDVFDRDRGRFWCASRRDELSAHAGLSTVPRLAEGRQTAAELRSLLGRSKLGPDPMEGLVVRKETGAWTTARAKVVRLEFLQPHDDHWRSRPTKLNRLGAPEVAQPN